MTGTRPIFALLAIISAVSCASSAVQADGADPKAGAASPPANDAASYDSLIDESSREHWAYLPIARPPIPSVNDAEWPHNPIDNFILANLEAKGWRPSANVDRRALLRRVFLDATGLPPTLDEQQQFRADESPEAYERLVDDLIARPGYGERWGRHWLDLVRFAETNGYERDAIKPMAWRYRDYVVDALNADKPFDRFVLEQLAGDELPDAATETVIATGYYRLGPWDDEPADFAEDRFDQLDDLVRTTSRVFLAMTLGCARCHNHKFDALTQFDYYRMVAIFDPLQRPQNGRTETLLPAGSRAQVAALRERDRQVGELQGRIRQIRGELRSALLTSGQSSVSAEVAAAFATGPDKRTDAQKQLVKKHAAQVDAEAAAAAPELVRIELLALEDSMASLKRSVDDLPEGYFLNEPSPNPPVTHLLIRGRASNPGAVVQPGMPAVLAREQPPLLESDAQTTRRRLSLAKWIADPGNPLTARVIVNRVWMYHFGQALVSTPSDFGVMGDAPTHPELLDWLAHWFAHDAGWSLKSLHRLILTSSTYRMSKQWNDEYGGLDPENKLFWRFPYRRLEVEAIRDSMLAASGQLNRKMRGESTYLSVPREALSGHSDPHAIWKDLDEREESRRTVYAFIKRSMVVPLLEVLDLCDSTQSAEMRSVTSVPTQALSLFNGEFVNRQAGRLAERLEREAGNDPGTQIDLAYRLALTRPPRPAETQAMLEFLERETAELIHEAHSRDAPLEDAAARRLGLERMCRVLFNTNEFAYSD